MLNPDVWIIAVCHKEDRLIIKFKIRIRAQAGWMDGLPVKEGMEKGKVGTGTRPL